MKNGFESLSDSSRIFNNEQWGNDSMELVNPALQACKNVPFLSFNWHYQDAHWGKYCHRRQTVVSSSRTLTFSHSTQHQIWHSPWMVGCKPDSVLDIWIDLKRGSGNYENITNLCNILNIEEFTSPKIPRKDNCNYNSHRFTWSAPVPSLNVCNLYLLLLLFQVWKSSNQRDPLRWS